MKKTISILIGTIAIVTTGLAVGYIVSSNQQSENNGFTSIEPNSSILEHLQPDKNLQNKSEELLPQYTPVPSQLGTSLQPEQNSVVAGEAGNGIDSSRKTYINNQIGITFQYPSTWTKNGEDANVTDLSGKITAIHINFNDTDTKTSLLIIYYPPPEGKEIYNFLYSQFLSSQGWYSKGGKKMNVAGNNAIVASMTLSEDGKGKRLDKPIKSTVVDLLDQEQTGTIEMQFKTLLSVEDSQAVVINDLLSSFKFVK